MGFDLFPWCCTFLALLPAKQGLDLIAVFSAIRVVTGRTKLVLVSSTLSFQRRVLPSLEPHFRR